MEELGAEADGGRGWGTRKVPQRWVDPVGDVCPQDSVVLTTYRLSGLTACRVIRAATFRGPERARKVRLTSNAVSTYAHVSTRGESGALGGAA